MRIVFRIFEKVSNADLVQNNSDLLLHASSDKTDRL